MFKILSVILLLSTVLHAEYKIVEKMPMKSMECNLIEDKHNEVKNMYICVLDDGKVCIVQEGFRKGGVSCDFSRKEEKA